MAILLVAENNTNSFIKSVIDFFSLLFYVAIISIPQTVYFYIISLSNIKDSDKKISRVVQHYYLPFILLIINIFSFFYLKLSTDSDSLVYDISVKIMNFSNFTALLFIFPVLNCYYIYNSVRVYRLHKENVPRMFSYDTGVDLRWMLEYIIGYCIFIVIIYLLQVYTHILALNIFTGLFLSFYLLYIGINGLRQKKVRFEKGLVRSTYTSTKYDGDDALISEDKANELKLLILEKIKEAPYLDKSLTINQFSKSIGSNSKYVSKILNTEFKQNFATFINSYRIEKAKSLLTSETYSKYTIETISEIVGFHSKSAFNKAFKSLAGITPSAYRKKNKASLNTTKSRKH
ncbi:helix-turn-helix domain-containing protein [Winogradskyella sp. J14-2]|uniref:helix-turn-helix domain-containing protein n=1 Tax=Winogradskyella sp. J14-2 TaxID=1936080 RepID=UPI0018DE9423|nr:helix-turn-helix domain-containing protein [Winogradskyella sp. J14-2]